MREILFRGKRIDNGEWVEGDIHKNTEFSKKLLIQESILIWIATLTFLVLAVFCILRDYIGELPWLTAMIAFPWAAYGVSQAWYYKKSLGENTKDGITFENMLQEWKAK